MDSLQHIITEKIKMSLPIRYLKKKTIKFDETTQQKVAIVSYCLQVLSKGEWYDVPVVTEVTDTTIVSPNESNIMLALPTPNENALTPLKNEIISDEDFDEQSHHNLRII